MKNRWIIFVVLFIFLVMVYGVRGMFQSRIELQVLQVDKIEEAVSTQGVLIKNEHINSLTLSGLSEIYAKDSFRVANGEIVAMLYGSSEDEALVDEFSQISKKINAIHISNADESVFIGDTMQIETEISNYVDDIIKISSENDFLSLSEYRYKIAAITAQRAISEGKDVISPAEELVKLQTRKNQIEKSFGNTTQIVSSDMAGVFVEGQDGFEEKMSVANIENLTPGDISDAIKGKKNANLSGEEGTYTYKIIDNFRYSVAVNLSEEMAEGLKIGDNVKLRFSDFSVADNSAVVKYISEPDEKGVKTVVAECDNYVKGLLSHRIVNVKFIKKSITGYKVDVEHIHTADNKIGVFIKRGAVMRFLPVNIEYSNEKEAIVTSADANMPIKSYDEIVTAAPEFSDGKVIVSQ